MKILSFICLLIVYLPSGNTFAQVMLKENGHVNNQYIVKFKTSFDTNKSIKLQKNKAFSLLRENQKKNIERLKTDLSNTDLKIKRSLWVNQSASIKISAEYLERLVSLFYVSEIQQDVQYQVEPLGTTSLTPSGETVQDNLFKIGIESVWNAGYRGQGVVVAIIDSGVDIKHATLKSRWRGGTNSWFDPEDSTVEPSDFSGHGTAVASIVLGGNENKTGSYLGVAPNAQWIAAKIFANSSVTSTSVIQEALQWVLDPDEDPSTDDYPDIIQNSWGIAETEGSCTTTEFNDSLDAINALGIDIVFAVGNSGPDASSRLAPSYHSDVISVGAVDATNASVETILNSSSRGPNLCEDSLVPALMAPGVDIVAAEKSLGSVSAIRNTSENTGTSFSSPHVSGAIALLRSQFDSSVDHLKFRDALFDSARDLGNSGDDNDYGRGLVKVDDAMTQLLNIDADKVAPEIKFSTANYVFSEDDSIAEVTLIRTGDISVDKSVTIISEGLTALQNIDFIPVTAQIDFVAGESSKNLSVELLNDDVLENTESFNLIISTTNVKKKITIADDDGGSPTQSDEDVIGGSSFGIYQLFFLLILLFGRRALR